MAVPLLLEEADIDPRDVLGRFGLSPEYFRDPENTLPYVTAGDILEHAAGRLGCPHFGLCLGQRAGATSLGVVGYLMLSAPDVRAALEALTGFLRVHDQGAYSELSMDGGFAILSYSLLVESVAGAAQIGDTAMVIARNLMQELCGREWRPSQVDLRHARPADVRPYARCFGVAPQFNAERNALVFPAKWLDRPLPSADPILHRLMRERASELRTGSHENLTSLVRQVIKPLLGTPHCSLATVAARLGMHRRTLNRRLAEEGTGFREVLQSLRLDAASQLLRSTRIPASEIAAMLGYSDVTAFSRAFRRWRGVGPAAWRSAPANDESGA